MYLLEMVLHAINLQAFVEEGESISTFRDPSSGVTTAQFTSRFSMHLFCLPVWVNSYVYDVIKSVNLYHLYPTKL